MTLYFLVLAGFAAAAFFFDHYILAACELVITAGVFIFFKISSSRRKKEVGELKSTGIVRPVDNLGRIVLPIELRRVLDIDKDAALEVYVDNDSIVLKKYQPACIFCGSAEGVAQYQGRNICGACREAIAALK